MNKKKYLNLVQDILNGDISYRLSIKSANELLQDETELSKYKCIKRFCRAYYEYQSSRKGIKDLLVNLRDVILTLKSSFIIGEGLLEYIKNTDIQELGMELNESSNGVELNATKNLPGWFEKNSNFYNVFDYNYYNSDEDTIGDPYLFDMTGYINYSCKAQKLIVRAIMNQIEGTTILGCMPTGAGKSLTFQMPAYYDKKGTTIVVVPTVALAMDQSKSSNKFYENKKYRPQAYYSGIDFSKRKEIFGEIERGELPLLFISPEALLNSSFNEVVMKAAQKGKINRLVIDEAHIITDWGEFFRTEFQLLAVFRKKLMEVTKNKLKTVMLSATLSDRTTNVLKFLFSEDNNFIEIRADKLREEIEYYIVNSNGYNQRLDRLMEMIPYIPKPFIIYVPTIKDANEIEGRIVDKQYYSIETFTSETSNDNRIKILKRWELDEIDIIVATSAFGMGVDKKEVRAVVHCYVPENIDRFYQEVGRCGRDKCGAISISFTSPNEDKNIITYLTRSKVLSVEKIVSRWQEIKNGYLQRVDGNKFWVSSDITPEYLREKDTITGKLNESWNEYVILFLYRHRLLDILEVKQDDRKKRHILIEIIDDILNEEQKLIDYLEPIRNKERESVNIEISNINSLLREKNQCWSRYFKKVYEYSERSCCGCPGCRHNKNNKPIKYDGYIEIVKGTELLNKSLYGESFFDQFNEYMYQYSEDILNEEGIKSIFDIIEDKEVSAIIIPNYSTDKFKEVIKKGISIYRYFNVYTYDDFLDCDNEQNIVGNIAVIYCDKDSVNNKLYIKLNNRRNKGYINKVVHISKEDMVISSENKRLIECVNTYTESI
ncbi:DEAD/DEAH box helicase [Oceanirhabdus seepicola]|uniref:ATP-dependent DNA helicase RecQ n=1 Tax=Oceanirhabdus seepicola TaxID=2828781 RepID=A0A9J6NX32_9CLOT|nr:DEAD/DEAH box helicase [Oceanirhabdus seepicola]MCM1988827.1 ATP-dependent DNA helicase RecQ [Oceanirhabdus seepicola]